MGKRTAITLTVKGLDAIEATQERREIADSVLTGLYYIIQPSNVRSWAFRYRTVDASGKKTSRKLTLGNYPAVGLADARALAKDAYLQVANGKDPATVKQAARNPIKRQTTAEIIEIYVAFRAKLKTVNEIRRILTKELVVELKSQPLDSIAEKDIQEIIDEYVTNDQLATATRTRSVLCTFFKWAKKRGHTAVDPCVGIDPPDKLESRDRELSEEEMIAVYTTAENYPYPYGPLLTLLFLTGQRRGMVAGLTWDVLDLKKMVWKVPKKSAKNKRSHIVPLSPLAVSVFKSLPTFSKELDAAGKPQSGLLFPGSEGKSISGFSFFKKAFDAEVERCSRIRVQPWIVHDIRRTASTSMSIMGTDQLVIDLILNHQTADSKSVSGIYNRNTFEKKKREAIYNWNAYLRSIEPFDEVADRDKFSEWRKDQMTNRKRR